MKAAILVATFLATTTAVAEEEKPRLKYRTTGPVCSCGSELGEDEIRQGRVKDFGQEAATASAHPEDTRPHPEQEERKQPVKEERP